MFKIDKGHRIIENTIDVDDDLVRGSSYFDWIVLLAEGIKIQIGLPCDEVLENMYVG